jgi:hypothetical protein
MGYPPREKKPAQLEILRQKVLGVYGALIEKTIEKTPESVRQAFDFTGIDHEAQKTADHLSGALRAGIRELGRKQESARQPALASGDDQAVLIARPRIRDKGKLDLQARRSELAGRLTAGAEANWLTGVDRAGLDLARRVQELARFEFISDMPKGREALDQGKRLEETAQSLYEDFARYMSGLADEAREASEDALAELEDRATDLREFFREYGQLVLNVAAVVHAIVQSEAWKAAVTKGSGGMQEFKDGAFAVLKAIVPLTQGLIAKLPMDGGPLAAVQVCIGGIRLCIDELDRSAGRLIRDAEIARLQEEDPGLARRILNSDPARMARRVSESQQAAVHRAFNVAGAFLYAVPEFGKYWPYVRSACEDSINSYYQARVEALENKLAEEKEKAGKRGTGADAYVSDLERFLDGEWEGSWEAIREAIIRAAGSGIEVLAEKLWDAGLGDVDSFVKVARKLSGIVPGLQDALTEIVPDAATEVAMSVIVNLATGILKYLCGKMVKPSQPVTGDEIWAVLRGLRESATDIPVLLGGSGGVFDEADRKGEEEYRRQQARKAEEARQERGFQRQHEEAAAESGIPDLDDFMSQLMSDALDGSGMLDGWLNKRPSILAIYHDAGSPDRTVRARADLHAIAREALETRRGAGARTLMAHIEGEAKKRILSRSCEDRISYLLAQALSACARRNDEQARQRMTEFSDEGLISAWKTRLRTSVLTHDEEDEVINQLLIPPADAGGRRSGA